MKTHELSRKLADARDAKRWWLGSLKDHELLRQTDEYDRRDRECTADLLARLGEIDRRRLYRDAGYPSMFAYCVHVRHYSEHAAYTRIRAARLARRWPRIFEAIAQGHLHLSALAMLAPVLTSANAAELLKAAERRTKPELKALLAEHFPRPDLPTCVHLLVPIAPNVTDASCRLVPERAAKSGEASESPCTPELVPERVEFTGKLVSSEHAEAIAHRAALTPLAPGRVALQVTVSTETHEKLRRAQELLGHSIAAHDLAHVLDRALDALIEKLEKRRYGMTAKPRQTTPAASPNPRHIPAAVKRAVRARDRAQCTFEANGRRCESRHALHFDHVIPIARGGRSTPENLRLLCAAHNQLQAERQLGEGFMRAKREQREQREQRGHDCHDGHHEHEAQRAQQAAPDQRATPQVQHPRAASPGGLSREAPCACR